MSRVPLHSRDRDKVRRGLVDALGPPLPEVQNADQNLQWVKLDSITPVDDRYDGQIYLWAAVPGAAGAFGVTGIGDVWVEFANGITPDDSTYYHAQEVDFEDGRSVFLVDDFATAGGGAAHTILNATAHTDSVTQTVSRGSLIVGNSTPKWDELPIGTSGFVLTSNGTDANWAAPAAAAHTILNATAHTDSVTQTVSRGSLIYGNSTPKWDELPIGTSGFVLTSNGTDVSWATAAHNILSATHSDSTAASVVRGDLITGQTATPKWTRLALGASGTVLTSNGTDVTWATAAHNLLSAMHGDTVTQTVSRGSLVVGNSTPKWDELAIGSVGKHLYSSGVDATWENFSVLSLVAPDLSADSFPIYDDSGAVNARVLLNKISFPHLAECRLSLDSSDPCGQNVTSGGSVYLHRYGGSWLSLREDHGTAEGSGVWIPRRVASSALSGSLAGLGVGGDGYVYAYWTGSAIALEITSTGTTTVEGVKVQSGDSTRRYVGYVLTGSGSGLAHDNPQFRHLFSWYNRIRKGFRVAVEGAGHTYNSATERSWGGTDRLVEICSGPTLDGMTDNIFAIVMSNHNAGAANANAYVTLGFNSNTVGALSITAENKGTARITTTSGRNWCPHEFGGIRETIYILESGDGTNAANFNEVALEGHIVC